MKPLSPALSSHLAAEVTMLATCWKLQLRDGAVFCFTDHDSDISVDGLTYKADSGITPGKVASSSLALDHMRIEGILNSEAITRADVTAGRFDFAALKVFMVNYADVSQGIIPLKGGWLGEVTLRNNQFVTEVKGLAECASTAIGDLYAPACRAKFGDSRCKLDLEDFTVTGTVTAVTSNRLFEDSSREEVPGYFTSGKISFTSGLNNGLTMEIKEYIPGVITLTLPMPYGIAIGDGYNMSAGCDKAFSTCVGRFSNALNFRGEPEISGQ